MYVSDGIKKQQKYVSARPEIASEHILGALLNNSKHPTDKYELVQGINT